jgi:hypothetical protein
MSESFQRAFAAYRIADAKAEKRARWKRLPWFVRLMIRFALIVGAAFSGAMLGLSADMLGRLLTGRY